MNTKVKRLLHEIDWALDSILPIKERVIKQKSVPEIMRTILQLKGHLLNLRDRVIVEEGIRGRVEFYQPLEVLPLEGIRMMYPDMPDDLAEKHFIRSDYRKISKARREEMAREEV